MRGRGSLEGLGALAIVVGVLLMPAAAQAQSLDPADPSFNCRAAAARLSLLNAPIEPLRANNNFNPCQDGIAGATSIGIPNNGSPIVGANAVQARTDLLCRSVGVDLNGALPSSDACETLRPLNHQAIARGEAGTVNATLGSGQNQTGIQVVGARSTARATCDSTATPSFNSVSNLVSLRINGNTIDLPAPNEPATINLGAARVSINERVGTEGRQSGAIGTLIRRALHVTVLPSGGGGLLELVLGESAVGFDGDVCSPAPGASGGMIVPLDKVPGHAGSPCRGPGFGPLIAILGTEGRDRITGTNFSDRIFGLGGRDDISGGRGNDCIEGDGGNDNLDGSNGRDYLIGGPGRDRMSGGPSNDRMTGGSGRDRLNGGTGNDRLRGGDQADKIRGGDGNDRLIGGRGNDGIHTGNGRDIVSSGPGNDVINAATRGPAARINCGPGRKDRVRINNNERRRIRGCEFIDVFRRLPRR